MFSSEERERAVDLYFTTPMTTAQVVEHLGYPTRQCLERWLAKDPRYAGHMAKPIIPLETRTKAIELVLGGMQQKQAAERLGVSIGAVHNWVKAYRKGGMAALQPRNRNASQSNKPSPRRSRSAGVVCDDAEALRRRVEELELENTLPVDRLRPAYSLNSMTCLLGIAPSSYHYHHARLSIDKYAGLRTEVAEAFAASKGRYGYRRIKATLRTGVSEKVIRRIMAGTDSSRMCPNDADTAPTRARPRPHPATSSNGISPPNGRTRSGPRTSPGIKARDGKGVPLAAGRLPRRQDRRVHRRFRSQRGARQQDARQGRGNTAGGGEAPGAFRPRPPLPVARMAGSHGTVRPGAVDGHQRLFA